VADIAMASRWESEGPGFKLCRLQTTFEQGLPKDITSDSQPKQCAFDE